MNAMLESIILDGEAYHPVKLSDVDAGEYFVRKAGAKRVYRRGHYDRAAMTR